MTDTRRPHKRDSNGVRAPHEMLRRRLRTGYDYRDPVELFGLLGEDLWFSLKPGQVQRAGVRLTVLSRWRAFVRAGEAQYGVRAGRIGSFLAGIAADMGVRVSRRTFMVWRRRLARFGPPGLVDYHGRRKGRTPLDPVCTVRLIAMLERGATLRAAHAAVAEFARRDGRRWPCLRALQLRLADARGCDEPPPRRVNETGGYLLSGLSAN